MSQEETPKEGGIRLNKFVAHSGICSRRQAAEHVKKGDVEVNGVVEKNPAVLVNDEDEIKYKGRIIRREKNMVYLLLNKPKNTVTTLSDEKDRTTVMDLVREKVKERIYPVGRLDKETTGLLLLTNDGDLAKKLTHPSHEIQKFYQVTLDKDVTEKDLAKIEKGLTLEDGPVPVDAVGHVKGRPDNVVGIEIHIGRNRIVRRIFESLGYEVKKLDRTYYAGLTKKDLPRGWSRFLTQQEIIMLKHFK